MAVAVVERVIVDVDTVVVIEEEAMVAMSGMKG